ncbi:MAG: hypothetical protein HY231_14560 [Acidobacteria bacterium]|nr:hypothetical protein [Acidobacteriota bacterium]
MKKFLLSVLAFSLALFVGLTAAAQSAGKIIDRYKKASGGDAVKKIKTTFITGSVKSGDALTGTFTQQTTLPNRFRTDLQVGEQKLSQCYNGKSVWRMDSKGLRTLRGTEAKRLRLEALLANSHLRDLAKARIFVQPPVKTSVNGAEAFAIEFNHEEAQTTLIFDAQSGLIRKQERDTAEGAEEIFYSDYRKVDGVMEPFAITIKTAANEWFITIEQVEHNRPTDEIAFRYPQLPNEKPLPEVETLMKAVVANQEKIEALREKYTFKQIETENKLDGNGRVKEQVVRISEVTPVGGRYVERLVSVNGKALAAKDQQDEDRRVQKEIEKILEEKAKRERQRLGAEGDKNKDEHADEERAKFTILGILRLSDVTSVRREIFRGHEVIAFDFEPKKGVKPKTRMEAIVNKLAGTMWIDEEARQIVRLEARFVEAYNFGGGMLAKISPSTALALEQQKVGNEVWMPSYTEVNISLRVFLLAKFNRNVVSQYSDYKKYSIDSQYEMEKPKDGKPSEKPVKN